PGRGHVLLGEGTFSWTRARFPGRGHALLDEGTLSWTRARSPGRGHVLLDEGTFSWTRHPAATELNSTRPWRRCVRRPHVRRSCPTASAVYAPAHDEDDHQTHVGHSAAFGRNQRSLFLFLSLSLSLSLSLFLSLFLFLFLSLSPSPSPLPISSPHAF